MTCLICGCLNAVVVVQLHVRHDSVRLIAVEMLNTCRTHAVQCRHPETHVPKDRTRTSAVTLIGYFEVCGRYHGELYLGSSYA